MPCTFLFLTLRAVCALPLGAQAGDDGWEVVLDGPARIPLKDVKFTAGIRRLSWLATEEKPVKPKAKTPVGPEYLDFREDKTPMYTEDVVTFIPLASLLRLDYEHDTKLVRATVKQPGGKDLTLVGPTKYANINKFTFDGTATHKTDLSVEGPLQFQDGRIKAPFRGIVHASAKAVDAPTGRTAVVVVRDKEKSQHPVQGLTPLYKVGAGQKLASVLMFQKLGQIDVAKIAVLRQLPPSDKKQTYSHDYEVTYTSGDKEKLTLLDATQLDGAAKAVLVGLVGRVPAGYKLFPPPIIAEVRFDAKIE